VQHFLKHQPRLSNLLDMEDALHEDQRPHPDKCQAVQQRVCGRSHALDAGMTAASVARLAFATQDTL
jgi:hypothetical protein